MSINPGLSAKTTPVRRFISRVSRLLEFATAPSKAIESPEKRRQAQILATLLLVSIASLIGVVLLRRFGEIASGGFLYDSSAEAILISLAVLLVCYVVSRTRHYLIAAVTTLVVLPAAIFSTVLAAPSQNLNLIPYLGIGLLISGMMFTLRTTALVALAYVGSSIVVLYGPLGIASPNRLYALIYLTIGTALILVFIHYRERSESDRQKVLAAAQDDLRASRELYRTLAQNLPQSAVLLYDRDLRFLLVEGSALAQIGYTKERLEGKKVQEVFEPGTTPALESDYFSALAGQESARERVINDQIYRLRYLPVRNDSGAIVAGMVLLQNITKEKQADAAVHESEERYRLMAENSTDLISAQKADATYVYASPAARVLLGYDPDEMIGHSAYEFVHPDDVDRVRKVHEFALQSSGGMTIAYRIRKKDGSYTWLESASRPVSNPLGETQIVTASRDVSERMEANEALRRSEEQFRSLIASMDNLVFSIDLSGHFLVYHPIPFSVYDTPFDTDVFVGKHYRDVLPEGLAAKLDDSVSLVLSTLATQQIEYSLDADGEERFYSARISPMIGASLHLLGSTVVVSDVTEAIRARQRQQRLLGLEKIQREIGVLFLETDDPDAVINGALEIMGTFFDVSRAYMVRLRENERLLDSAHEWCAPGVSSEFRNLQGLAYDQLFPSLLPLLVHEGVIAPQHISELAPDLYRAFDAQGIQSVLFMPFFVDERLDGFFGFDEIRHPRQWLPEEIAAIRTFVQSCARVFERQRAQAALINARDSALRSAKLKSDFVSNMSHELRTPMTGVIGMLDLLHETNLTQDQREFVEIAHVSANRLLELIGDILDFSKIESGKVALENIPLDARGIVTEVQSLLTMQAAKKHLDLTASVDEEVPARVLGDPTRLRQILTNLVGNAIKFTESGSIHIALHQINAAYGRSRLLFEVSDTGIGIPEDRQAQIFDSFVQADSSTTRRYGGAGLGLAICKQLVALMGGEIGVRSVVGQGSTFSFTLTLPIVALTGHAALNSDFNYLQVMVMDEENSARYLLAEQLRLWGTNVIEASSMDEARQLLIATARREEEVEVLFFRSRQTLAEQEALVTSLHAELGAQTPLLVQFYDDEALASSAFDLRLRRPVHPSDLYQLLANHADRDFVPTPPLREDQLLPAPSVARILVADDEPMNRQIVVHALEQFGYTVDIAHDGAEVLTLLDQHDYHLILMDMHMPVMSGLEATKRIRAQDGSKSRVPIIAFTASIEQEQRRSYLDNGINAIIGKPFTIHDLRQTVEAWMTP